MKQKQPAACSGCGRTDINVTTYVHAITHKQHYMCILCEVKDRDKAKKRNIASYDEELKEFRNLEQMYEELILSMPKEVNEMQGLHNTMKTPMSIYRDIKEMIAHLEAKRMEAVITEGGRF